MTLNFSGDRTSLKDQLSSLSGEWDESCDKKIVFKSHAAKMHWDLATGDITFKGPNKDKQPSQNSVAKLLERRSDREISYQHPIQQRMQKLVSEVSTGMFEREEIIAVSLLGALSGQNTFLLGPPGTAKSLISRRIACAFEDTNYFEYLMNRFSTPEEVFGPVSIKELKNDNYIRKTDNYLPKAEFAFLDEIWKSSPAILNTLLTLINERVFRNGGKTEQAPLRALIAASNETPEKNQGLEALYDRFLLRMHVSPIKESIHFDKLISARPTEANTVISEGLKVSSDEWQSWLKQIHNVKLSSESLTVIHLIRAELAERFDELNVYVSDRRWQKIAHLIKASAFFNGRTETNHSDLLLIEHCLWSDDKNRQLVIDIVVQAIKEIGVVAISDLTALDREKDNLDNEIFKELFFTKDVYDIRELGDKKYFVFLVPDPDTYYSSTSSGKGINKKITMLVSTEYAKTKKEFHPITESGNVLRNWVGQYDGQGSCSISNDYQVDHSIKLKPTLLFERGSRKKDINQRLVASLADSVSAIKSQLSQAIEESESKFSTYIKQLESPFVPTCKVEHTASSLKDHIERLKLRVKDCERLEELCR